MTSSFDLSVLEWFISQRTPALDAFFSTITYLGSAIAIGIIATIAAVFAFVQHKRTDAVLIVVTVTSGWTLMVGLKFLANRDRPGPELALIEVANSAFPSGHAMMATILAIVLAATVVKTKLAWPLLAVLPLLVGVSRVYLGVHWPTDALAGWAVGFAWGFACVALHHALRPAEFRKP
ncbi:phosphatase PAP2 family protein [Hoyosella rhizosphaerae]|uniref:Phosphatidic acid phosphatase type 2/haloperoxidase domain-containing protein n=1 Tax=Hoyosella rhizosphaerae TaxID=1755582 RepID=A0A916UH23_9ACTN|nr:phosphatase PAP2 family protein [Hoyosella rhizosphaerae]MBN4928192.1 phosphatase PAP2 family protein [Hoyosella rhizosphaerae]GGC73105.1 hypothetical protein GCM10011410_27770 [Hoyosella rhizosphaerae]